MSERSQPRTPASIASTWGSVERARKSAPPAGSSPAPRAASSTTRVVRTSSSSRSNSENPLPSLRAMTTPFCPISSGEPAGTAAVPPVSGGWDSRHCRAPARKYHRYHVGQPAARCATLGRWTPRGDRAERRLERAEILAIGTELTSGETRDTNSGELARAPDRRRRRGRPTDRVARPAGGRRRGPPIGAPRRRPRRHDRRARPDPGRPDPRGGGGGLGRIADRRPGPRGLAARPVAASRAAVPGNEPQAGLAHPVGARPGQPERDRTGLVGRPARWPRRRAPAGSAARDATDVARRGPPEASGAWPRRRPCGPHPAPHRDRRVARRRPARGGDPARREPRGLDLRPRRRGRRPARRGGRSGSGRATGPIGQRAARRDRADHPGRGRRARLGARRDRLGRGDRNRARPARLVARDPRARDGRRARDAPRRTGLARPGRGRHRAARPGPADPVRAAGEIRAEAGSDVGLAVSVRARGKDTAVSVGVATPSRTVRRRSMVFLGGELGRSRSAIAGAALLLETLRGEA